MRHWFLIILAVFAVSCYLLAAYAQEDMSVIVNPVFGNPKRPPAVFEHDPHNELAAIEECNICHHLYEDGKLIEDESSEDLGCADCHEMQDIGRKPGLMKAFHTHCKSCHREKKKGPLMCGQCHLRQ
ncbi:MAG: cytochrome c family protein [Desulfobacterales bacterium]|nr:cytochrome c family protein [Desulfobacterales bacterium]